MTATSKGDYGTFVDHWGRVPQGPVGTLTISYRSSHRANAELRGG